MSVAPALESDLEPFHKLKRLVLRAPVSPSYVPSVCQFNNTSERSFLTTQLFPRLPPWNTFTRCIPHPPFPTCTQSWRGQISEASLAEAIIPFRVIPQTLELVLDLGTGCTFNSSHFSAFGVAYLEPGYTFTFPRSIASYANPIYFAPRCSSLNCAAHNFG